ncbi:GNAT family N-acetyltransferase [Thermohalobacter berrensis]|uniref:GNAT family N-acetyltransferase n=1 Tax=Thermohalobacter berrensis TaxID=99594 RepID=A0A419T9Y0_9FIRM|nr:GNAT family N-acetyltransferase [Thermohalobacter berrensis]RKD34257.1 GNAT family N-acetyltransferase [Thermohalobacter berrensis]
MVVYKNCKEVSVNLVYEAFKRGFADYIVKFDISKEGFIKRFLGPEGNDLNYSFIALDNEEPIGVVLGGIKKFDGLKTMRCGALCVIPSYRGTGVAQKLFNLHKETAIKNKCKQLFLEVIVGNDRAINFYKKLGYEKVYNLHYYILKDVNKIKGKSLDGFSIKPIEIEDIKYLKGKMIDTHINWQNTMDYIEKLDNQYHYGIYDKSELIGGISISKTGEIKFLWIEPEFRNKGLATNLSFYTVKDLKLNKLFCSFPNNSLLEGFFRKNDFTKSELSQYEMYLPL